MISKSYLSGKNGRCSLFIPRRYPWFIPFGNGSIFCSICIVRMQCVGHTSNEPKMITTDTIYKGTGRCQRYCSEIIYMLWQKYSGTKHKVMKLAKRFGCTRIKKRKVVIADLMQPINFKLKLWKTDEFRSFHKCIRN